MNLSCETGMWPETMTLLDLTSHIGYEPALAPFARDELLCRMVGRGGEPILHLWRHPRAFIMGLRDSRLPLAKEATSWLHDLGYATAVRNSGGAAVPLDPGVLNVSLIMPKPDGRLEFRPDFERMAALLGRSFAERTQQIRAGEVEGSYCPGEFDLSIAGRKFCGIAQRRHANAIVVQAFVVVEGMGAERAALAKMFYDKVAGDARDYPHVRPETMGSLSELTGRSIRAEESAADIIRFLESATELRPAAWESLPSEADVARTVQELQARYAR